MPVMSAPSCSTIDEPLVMLGTNEEVEVDLISRRRGRQQADDGIDELLGGGLPLVPRNSNVTAISPQRSRHKLDRTLGPVTAEHAAKVIAKAATASRPRTRHTVGRDAAIIVRLVRVTPDRLLDRILRLGLRSHHVKTTQPAAVMTARSR
jgi:hypothetical protein